MEFRIDPKSNKTNIDEVFYKHKRLLKEQEEKEQQEIKRKQIEHLEKYHFKSVDEIKQHLLSGKILYPDKTFGEIIIDNQEIESCYFEGESEIIENDMCLQMFVCVCVNGDRVCFPFYEFEKQFFFTLIPGSTGYIDKWHKI